MAYVVKLSKKCNTDACSKSATHRLYNNRNSDMGDFCTTCVKVRLKRLQESEKINTL